MQDNIKSLKEIIIEKGMQNLNSFFLIKECIIVLNEFYKGTGIKATTTELNSLYNECRIHKFKKSQGLLENNQ